jgi:queuine/archaeosine tRNA-ribosyltransferase
MKFVVSLTMNASDLRQTIQLWDDSGDPRNPFANVLVSPLFIRPSTLRIVREELKEKRGSQVYFDSGGYYVQQGRLTYEELYGLLMDYYRQNRWADWYVLPDWVPTSRDDPQTVEHKIRATITVSKLFYNELPDELKERVLPVVQAHTKVQVIACMEAYSKFAVGPIGFGSFGTSGSTNGVNTITDQSVEMLRTLIDFAKKGGFNTHLFGVSTPPILYLFRQLEIASFDSMAWMKAAGYGNVFLPLVRGYMATYRVAERTHTYHDQFERLKALTGHRCPFCDDFSVLISNRMYRIMHNLASVLDTVDLLQRGHLSHEEIMQVIALGSPSYLRYYGVH